jgi:hypothetical protein
MYNYRSDDYMVRPVKVLAIIGTVLFALTAIVVILGALDEDFAFSWSGTDRLTGLLAFFCLVISVSLVSQTQGDGRRNARLFLVRLFLVIVLVFVVFTQLSFDESLRSLRVAPFVAVGALPFVCAIVLTVPAARKRWKVLLVPMVLMLVVCVAAAADQEAQLWSFYDQLEVRYGDLLRDKSGLSQMDAAPPAQVRAVVYDDDRDRFVRGFDYPASPDDVTVIIIRSKTEVTTYSDSRWYVDSAGNRIAPVDSANTGIDTSVRTTDRYLDVGTLNIYDVKR